MLVTLKRVLFILLAILGPVSLQAEERGPHIAAGFANKTVFAWTASRNSWNAFFASDGTVTYWHSDDRISKGTWRPVGDQVCIDLGNGPACRVPTVQDDATIAWLRPETQNASSTINFMLDGDELGLAAVRSDDLSTTLRSDVRTTYALGGRDAPVQLASRRTYQEALTLMEQFRSDGIPAGVALSRNGFFAVFAEPASGMRDEDLSQLKNASRIPSEAFFVDPYNYARIYHISGSSLGSSQTGANPNDLEQENKGGSGNVVATPTNPSTQMDNRRLPGPFEWVIQELREDGTEVPYCSVSLISGGRVSGRTVFKFFIEIDGRISELRYLSLNGLDGRTGYAENDFGRLSLERYNDALGFGRNWYRSTGDDVSAFIWDLADSQSMFLSSAPGPIRYELPTQNIGPVTQDAVRRCQGRDDDADSRRALQRQQRYQQCYAECIRPTPGNPWPITGIPLSVQWSCRSRCGG